MAKEQVGPDTWCAPPPLSDVELVKKLEEEFDINISDDAAAGIGTVGELIGYIEEPGPAGGTRAADPP